MGKQTKATIYVAISIDVEEEGLFSGRYPRHPEGVSNVAELTRLRFVTREFAIPLTLLADYPVLASPVCRGYLARFHEDLGAEIGTHLHPWNTPPFSGEGLVEPVAAQDMGVDLLREKLQTLIETAQNAFGMRPTAFRMGRFDFAPNVRKIIGELGYTVDSSVVPFRLSPGTADCLFSSADPYFLQGDDQSITEVPVTMVALNRWSTRLVAGVCQHLPAGAVGPVLGMFRRLAVCGPHPAWFPLISMKNAARLHIRRDGRVLNIFLHSTEIAPGMSPASSDKDKAEAVVARLRAFLAWLHERYDVRGITLSELPDLFRV